MVVAVIGWELHLAGCQSLKDKRKIVKSLKDRLHGKFNVSVAETNHHELWQRCELTCCVVSNESKHAREVLSAAEALVAKETRTRIIDSWTEMT